MGQISTNRVYTDMDAIFNSFYAISINVKDILNVIYDAFMLYCILWFCLWITDHYKSYVNMYYPVLLIQISYGTDPTPHHFQHPIKLTYINVHV